MRDLDITAMIAGLALTTVVGGFAIGALIDEQPKDVTTPPVMTQQQQADLRELLVPSEATLHPPKTAGPVPVNFMDFYQAMISPTDRP